MEPTETKALKPTSSCCAQSRIAVQSAPLWLMNATLPGTRHAVRGEGGIETADRIHHAQAVRADHAHAAAAELLQNLAFEFLAVLAVFLESGGNDDRAAHSRGHALPDHRGHAVRRSHDDGQVDGLGNVLARAVGLDAEHAGALVADRINGAAERAAQQAPEHGAADAALARSLAPITATLCGLENCIERMAFGAQDVVRLVLGGR